MTRLEKLEAFYQEVIRLTVNHDALYDDSIDESFAVVFPNKLHAALAKVDENWSLSQAAIDGWTKWGTLKRG